MTLIFGSRKQFSLPLTLGNSSTIINNKGNNETFIKPGKARGHNSYYKLSIEPSLGDRPNPNHVSLCFWIQN